MVQQYRNGCCHLCYDMWNGTSYHFVCASNPSIHCLCWSGIRNRQIMYQLLATIFYRIFIYLYLYVHIYFFLFKFLDKTNEDILWNTRKKIEGYRGRLQARPLMQKAGGFCSKGGGGKAPKNLFSLERLPGNVPRCMGREGIERKSLNFQATEHE